MPTISSTLNVNTLDDAEVYYVEWKDNVGLISSIPCYGNGWAKDNYGGAEEWFRATLFKRVGSSEASAVQCYEIVLRAYLADGTQVVNSSWPKNVNNASYIALVGYDENISHMTYKAEFYSLNHELLGSYSISRSVDGSSAPRYTEEQYAWSNVSSTSGVGEEPSPNSGWQTSIGSQGSYAYLWKKIVLYTFNIATNQYTAGTPQYYRMNGENGTSIRTKGSVRAVIKYWASSISDLPTSGETGGTLAWVDGDSFLMEYHEGSTGWWSQSISLNEGDRIICTDTVNRTAAVRKNIYEFDGIDDLVSVGVTVNDGDAYTEAQNGHLMQWSQEATNWLDLGQFKGESGVTYYTHIAWADGVTFRSTPLAPASGCLNKQNASSVTGGTITPRTSQSASKPYMGIRIDQIAGSDSRDYLTYTWDLVQGAKGDRGKTGKFYYYAGVFNDFAPSDTFLANDANAPYFEYKNGNETHYWVFVKEVSEGRISKSEMGEPSSSNADWEIMTDDFKYMITEAIFGNFAKFGSFIISGHWMISQQAATGSSSQSYTDFGKNVPDGGDPLVDNGTNFIPVFAVDGLTGRTYQQDAVIRGQVNATSGSIGGFHIDNEELRVGNNADWTNPQTNHPYTLLGKGRSRFLNDDGNSLVQVSVGLNSETTDSRRALTVIRNDKYNNYPNSPAVEIRHISSYGSIGLRVQSGVAVFQEGIIPFSDFHYVDSNITLSGLYSNSIFFKGESGTHQVTLPTYTEILDSLTYGMPSNVFALELTLATHIGSDQITIKMPSGGYIMDYNGNIANSITIAAGKYVKLMLVYDGSTYYAQKVYASYDM